MSSDVTLKLHNTLTRTKEDFVPLDPANVRLYVCGPTVYDFAHIGNARPAIVFDVLFRLLRHVYGAEHVTYVRNITDVDDKINARAVRDFPDLPLNEAIRKVTETTAAQYQKDTAALGCLEPTVQPRATDNIEGMQKLIGQLIANQHAYEAAQIGEVLFDVKSMPDYGALSGRDLENNLAGARVEIDTHKRNPADFVLWKKSSASEPGWDSPWGRGRPGWHIECSAMSERYLGPVFDIHGGGLDLIFPHHENELAQSRCAHGTETMARYWLHNGFLQVEGQKMSKSLGNFITINDVLSMSLSTPFFELDGVEQADVEKGWNGLAARLAMLISHYRAPIDWTQRKFEEARTEVIAWHELLKDIAFDGLIHDQESVAHYVAILADDLNTPAVVAALRDAYSKKRHRELGVGLVLLGLYDQQLMARYDLTIEHIRLGEQQRVERLVVERLAALSAIDFARADEIRAALLAEGIQLMDSKNDAGERVTKWEIKR